MHHISKEKKSRKRAFFINGTTLKNLTGLCSALHKIDFAKNVMAGILLHLNLFSPFRSPKIYIQYHSELSNTSPLNWYWKFFSYTNSSLSSFLEPFIIRFFCSFEIILMNKLSINSSTNPIIPNPCLIILGLFKSNSRYYWSVKYIKKGNINLSIMHIFY